MYYSFAPKNRVSRLFREEINVYNVYKFPNGGIIHAGLTVALSVTIPMYKCVPQHISI